MKANALVPVSSRFRGMMDQLPVRNNGSNSAAVQQVMERQDRMEQKMDLILTAVAQSRLPAPIVPVAPQFNPGMLPEPAPPPSTMSKIENMFERMGVSFD